MISCVLSFINFTDKCLFVGRLKSYLATVFESQKHIVLHTEWFSDYGGLFDMIYVYHPFAGKPSTADAQQAAFERITGV